MAGLHLLVVKQSLLIKRILIVKGFLQFYNLFLAVLLNVGGDPLVQIAHLYVLTWSIHVSVQISVAIDADQRDLQVRHGVAGVKVLEVRARR